MSNACSPCHTRARDLFARAPEVPAGFWAVDEISDALASWHMGRVITAYRRHPHHPRQLPQDLVAGWVGITQAQLSRIENGPAPKDLDKLIQWAQILRIPERLLWFRLPDHSPTTERAPLLAQSDEPSISGITTLLQGLSEDRIVPTQSRADSIPIGISPLAGFSLADSTRLLLGIFLQLDDQIGGNTLYLPLSQYVARLAVNADEGSTDVLQAFGQLCQMTGWLALDSNLHAAARRHLTTAFYVAMEADDDALAASSLAYLSLQDTYRDRPRSALSLAQTADSIIGDTATPRVRTMLKTRLARAQSGLGQHNECARSVEEAQKAFTEAGTQEEPSWAAYVDEIELTAQIGTCHLNLGRSNEATYSMCQALSLLERKAPHRVRDRMHYLTRLAKAHLLANDVEQACAVADEAVTLGREVGSPRIDERIREFDSALEPFAGSIAARNFRERLATGSG